MRIAFDARVLAPARVGGTRTYLLEVLRALSLARPGWELVLYVDHPLEGDAAGLLASPRVRQVALPPRRNPAWVQVELARALRRDGADIFHAPGYFVPLAWRGVSVVTVHDLNMYLHPGRWLRQGRVMQGLDLAVQTPVALVASRAVITVSEASARSISRVFPPVASRLNVIPLAPSTFFDRPASAAELQAAGALAGGGPFVLAVGEVSPQKRLEAVIDGLAGTGGPDPTRLVIAGPQRVRHSAALQERARSAGLGDRVRFAGPVSDGILRALYRGAACLVVASDGEGFGLPLVEAMACGTPVIAASRGALPEVMGGAGLMFDPDRPGQLAALLTRVLTDPGYRADLSRKSLLRRQAFSWERTAEMTSAVYEVAASR